MKLQQSWGLRTKNPSWSRSSNWLVKPTPTPIRKPPSSSNSKLSRRTTSNSAQSRPESSPTSSHYQHTQADSMPCLRRAHHSSSPNPGDPNDWRTWWPRRARGTPLDLRRSTTIHPSTPPVHNHQVVSFLFLSFRFFLFTVISFRLILAWGHCDVQVWGGSSYALSIS